MRPAADKIIVLTGASLFSFLFLELFCRVFLSLGNNYSETSIWQQEKWLEDHHGSQSTVAYTIDRYDSILGWTLKEGLTEQMLVSPPKGGKSTKRNPSVFANAKKTCQSFCLSLFGCY